MFTEPAFLSALGVGTGVGLLVLFWIGRRFRAALREANQPASAVNFWAAVIQLSAIFVPVIATMMAQQNAASRLRDADATSIVMAACGGALFVILAASLIVGWATLSPASDVVLSVNDSNELKQLLHRMREFRAHEISRAAEAAKSGSP